MRVKIIIISVSIVIISITILFRTNFYKESTYTRWRAISWEDFQGFPVLFTGWGAAISSNIYVEYDTLKSIHVAYAAMNNQKSWKKLSFEGSEYTLRHEQYHFNLTESFARLMNTQIKNDSLDEYEVKRKLKTLRKSMNELQKQYDEECNHGLLRDMQRYWEYKIDSMMLVNSGDSGVVIDYLSGASMFLPHEVNIFSGDRDGSAYRIFGQESYDMVLTAISSNYLSDFSNLEKDLQEYYERDSMWVQAFERDTSNQSLDAVIVEAYLKDSSEFVIDKWILNSGLLYELRAKYPVRKRSEGYRRIAMSTFKTFDLFDSRNYWKSKFDSSEGFVVTAVTSEKVSKEVYKEVYCSVYNSQQGIDYGVIGVIISLEDGYIVPFDPTYTEDSLIYEVKLVTDRNVSTSHLQETYEDFLFIPDKTDSDFLTFSIGYTLLEDTNQICFQFYNNYFQFSPGKDLN